MAEGTQVQQYEYSSNITEDNKWIDDARQQRDSPSTTNTCRDLNKDYTKQPQSEIPQSLPCQDLNAKGYYTINHLLGSCAQRGEGRERTFY